MSQETQRPTDHKFTVLLIAGYAMMIMLFVSEYVDIPAWLGLGIAGLNLLIMVVVSFGALANYDKRTPPYDEDSPSLPTIKRWQWVAGALLFIGFSMGISIMNPEFAESLVEANQQTPSP